MNLTAMMGPDAAKGIALRMEAYAPDPMVLDTNRKGRLSGNGATCDCKTESVEWDDQVTLCPDILPAALPSLLQSQQHPNQITRQCIHISKRRSLCTRKRQCT